MEVNIEKAPSIDELRTEGGLLYVPVKTTDDSLQWLGEGLHSQYPSGVEAGHRKDGFWFRVTERQTAQAESGSAYIGWRERGMRKGDGVHFSVGYNFYIGEWQKDRRHGIGKNVTLASGEEQIGLWEDGKFVKSDRAAFLEKYRNGMPILSADYADAFERLEDEIRQVYLDLLNL
eukprot:UC4_evm1s1206